MKRLSFFKEDLRKWFSSSHPEGGWKRINSKGEAIGPCAREPGEAKPKCMSNEKRAKLSKDERASAVRAKRRHDPNPERKGKPINVSNFGKGKISEMKQLDEKNVPTSPEKWAQAKAQAKAKFDVYPSAYANGWAAKKYKAMGGGWKSVSEGKEEDPPFEGGHPAKKQAVPGKHGSGYSTARHLARMAAKREMEKLKKKPVKEETEVEVVNEDLKSAAQKLGRLAKFHYQFAKKRMKNPDTELSSQEKQDWRKVHEETEDDTEEKNEMTLSQLHFMKYACEEIINYINDGGEVEEWYQVKVAKSFSEFESLHAFMEGEKRRKGMVKEEQIDEVSKETMKSYQSKAMHDTISGKKDRTKGLSRALVKLSGVDKPILKKEEAVVEQHREEGRFKPTVPRNVPNVSASGTRKANIVKAAAKKTAVVKDKFEPNPELGTTLTKNV